MFPRSGRRVWRARFAWPSWGRWAWECYLCGDPERNSGYRATHAEALAACLDHAENLCPRRLDPPLPVITIPVASLGVW